MGVFATAPQAAPPVVHTGPVRGPGTEPRGRRARRMQSPAGSASVQVQRRLAAQTNRTLGDDDQLGGFSLKGLIKGAGNVVKAVAAPVAKVGVNFIPGGGLVKTVASALIPKKAAPPPPPPPPPPSPPPALARPMRALPASKPVVKTATPKAKVPVVASRTVKVAPDLKAKPGTKAVALKKEESSLQKQIDELKTGAKVANKVQGFAAKAKEQSKVLRGRANSLAASAEKARKLAEKAAEAGDAVGAAKFSEQARAIATVAQNTAAAATDAGQVIERAGVAVNAGVNAGLAAGATGSETFGGIVGWATANPAKAAAVGAGVLGAGYLGYKALKKKR